MIGKVTPAIFADPDEAIARSKELTAQFGRPIKGLGIIVDDAVIGENRRWTWIRKDGGRIPVSMTVSAMRADDGRIIGYVGMAHDITKQVAYETALQREIAKSEAVGQTLDTALSNMKQGLAMYDANYPPHRLQRQLHEAIRADQGRHLAGHAVRRDRQAADRQRLSIPRTARTPISPTVSRSRR